MAFRVIIPARYAATRLPGKPLRELAGKPLIEHVYDCARRCGAAQVIIATDDERIHLAAQSFGAEVCMTSKTHTCGTERLAEVIDKLILADDEIVVNLQGDEPLMPPQLIRQVAENLHQQTEADVATLCVPLHKASDVLDSNIVKVVMNRAGYALYFSRAPIPCDRRASVKGYQLAQPTVHFRHIGLYAYRAGFIRTYVHWLASPLEQVESLEQLRVLWYGGKIHVAQAVETPGPGVDTEQDLIGAAALLASRIE